MKAVVHQPYFLPWMGYFSKLVYADKFIILDNVNFTKGSYIDRTKIINGQGNVLWIGLPIGQQFKKPCNQITFSNSDILIKIIKTLYSSYSKGRYFRENIQPVENILLVAFEKYSLVEINISIIVDLMKMLALEMPEVILSSQLPTFDNPTTRLLNLLTMNGCDQLITGAGGSLIKHNMEILASNGIEIYLQDYLEHHPHYYQTRRTNLGFAKGLSIIDCLFNEGIERTRNLLTLKTTIPHVYISPNRFKKQLCEK